MNDETALQIIEDYFGGKATKREYEAALSFFETAPASRSRLVKLYKALVEPGGISCETCQEAMPGYLDTVARREMSATEREQFLLHVSQCVNCAEEYFELASFERGIEQASDAIEVPRFKIPKPAIAPAKSADWPRSLRAVLDKVLNTGRVLKVSLRFEPVIGQTATGVIRETPASYATDASRLILFSGQIEAASPLEIEVIASRSSIEADNCEVQINLHEPKAVQFQDDYSVRLTYGDYREEKPVNEKGQAVFEAVQVAVLPNLHLEITINQ